ncbi:MAG: helix-turn-helix domain-containing protein [Oscillibacter sp.]|nr:helix-turn-helix domain-containing protein [Oscillibacter sp.]
MPEFKTIRQTAATKIISESYLRQLVAQGKCPGIRVGNRFLVNVGALAEMLDAESRKAVNAQ